MGHIFMCFNQYIYKTKYPPTLRQVPGPRRINDMATLVHVHVLGYAPMNIHSTELTQTPTFLLKPLFYCGHCFSCLRVRLRL